MSYPRKQVQPRNRSLPARSGPVGKMTEAQREKLIAIHQREQLKGMLVSKFLEKYGASKGLDTEAISKEVNSFMKNEKLTEENLRRLEQKIKDGNLNSQHSVTSEHIASSLQHKNTGVNQSMMAEVGGGDLAAAKHIEKHALKSGQRPRAQSRPNSRGRVEDNLSVADSERPKSIYMLGNEEDEWATMLKYDQQLYLKEKELEKIRDLEMKKKMRAELDKQVEERKRAVEKEKMLNSSYVGVLSKQLENFDEKVRQKSVETKQKIWTEKLIRDKQLQDESIRKRVDKRTEKEIEDTMMRKIQNDIEADIRTAAEKRKAQKDNLRKIMEDNEARRRHVLEEQQKQKELDLKEQEEYNHLQEVQEARRAAEAKAREERNKKILLINAENIMKEQKSGLANEDRAFMMKTMEREAKLQEEDRIKKQKEREQKLQIRAFLDKQLVEREQKKQSELALEKQQAEIWRKDVQDFEHHEKVKHDTLKVAHLNQADFLKRQMEEEKARNRKMNAQEALLNKSRLKEIADVEGKNFQRLSVN